MPVIRKKRLVHKKIISTNSTTPKIQTAKHPANKDASIAMPAQRARVTAALPAPVASSQIAPETPQLIRTEVNSANVRKLVIAISVIAIVVVAGVGWYLKDWLWQNWKNSTAPTIKTVYQLTVPKQEIDQQRAQQILQASPAITSSTPSAEAIDQNGNAPLSPQFSTDLSSKNSRELVTLLQLNIDLLKSEGVDVTTLIHYMNTADKIQDNDVAYRNVLLEAITVSNELQMLYLYYQR